MLPSRVKIIFYYVNLCEIKSNRFITLYVCLFICFGTQMGKRELFFCCKTGNLSRVRYLVEEKDIDLNSRDKWGGTPLYYACLCGHYEIVLYLLQNGVQCDANTFDGERCLYGALTDDIRHLLRNFKVISAATMRRDKYSEFLRRTFELSDYSDIEFLIENEKILAHRSILSCRSKYFQSMFSKTWKDEVFVDLSNHKISARLFKDLMQYLYMGQVRINKTDCKEFIAIADQFNVTSVVAEINKILLSSKKASVLYVQSQPLPQQDILKLFLSSLPKELQIERIVEEPLFVDLHINVNNHIFFCHKVFICGRCSYLKTLVVDHFAETTYCDDKIQVITLHDTDSQVFLKVLQYIYTDTADLSTENVLDVLYLADLYILPGLKKLCALVIQQNLTIDNIFSLIKIIRLYNLSSLEDQCTEFMAEHLEEIINNADFKNLIMNDASEIKNRQEVDTIPVIDDIRYHIDKSERVSNSFQKHLLISELLQNMRLEA